MHRVGEDAACHVCKSTVDCVCGAGLQAGRGDTNMGCCRILLVALWCSFRACIRQCTVQVRLQRALAGPNRNFLLLLSPSSACAHGALREEHHAGGCTGLERLQLALCAKSALNFVRGPRLQAMRGVSSIVVFILGLNQTMHCKMTCASKCFARTQLQPKKNIHINTIFWIL